jgi:hypothetical protein
MNFENATSELRGAPMAQAFSWPNLHLRLESSRAALQRKLSPGKDEKTENSACPRRQSRGYSRRKNR